jgi:hypothetical protein
MSSSFWPLTFKLVSNFEPALAVSPLRSIWWKEVPRYRSRSPNVSLLVSTARLPAGAEVLQLKTDNLANGFADHAIWAYPFLHKATNLPY